MLIEVVWNSEEHRIADGYRVFSSLNQDGILQHGDLRQLNLANQQQIAIRTTAEDAAELAMQSPRMTAGKAWLRELRPASVLLSHLTTIKGKMCDQDLRSAVVAEVRRLGIICEIEVLRRGVIWIHGKSVVGYGVRLSGLSAEHSLTIQERGIGGRRRFGCGVFVSCE